MKKTNSAVEKANAIFSGRELSLISERTGKDKYCRQQILVDDKCRARRKFLFPFLFSAGYLSKKLARQKTNLLQAQKILNTVKS